MSERQNWLTALQAREIDGIAVASRMAAWVLLLAPLGLIWLVLFSPLIVQVVAQDEELEKLARLQAAYESRLLKSDDTQAQKAALEKNLSQSHLIWKVARRQDAESQMQSKLRQLVMNAHGQLRSIQIVPADKTAKARSQRSEAKVAASAQSVQRIALKGSISFREAELSGFIEKLQAARPLLGVSDLSMSSTRRPTGVGKPLAIELHLDLTLYGFVWERG